MPIVKMLAKGQVVIPKQIREALRIVAGAKLYIGMEGKKVVLYPRPTDPHWGPVRNPQGRTLTDQGPLGRSETGAGARREEVCPIPSPSWPKRQRKTSRLSIPRTPGFALTFGGWLIRVNRA